MIEVNEDEIEVLISLVNKITATPSDQTELFCQQTKNLSKELPIRMQIELTNFVENGTKNDFLLIKGLENIEKDIPDTL